MKTPQHPKVTLLSKPEKPDAVSLCAAAARLCYKPASIRLLTEERIPRSEEERLFLHVVKSRHWSCLRHANFVFGLEGVSRSFSHQLVRHVVGHSYEQQSQHYILEKGEEFDHVALNRGPNTPEFVSLAEEVQREHMLDSKRAYDKLIAAGYPREEARQMLPNMAETRLIWTVNLNAILHTVQVRACRVNCEEILQVAVQVRKIIKQEIPILEPFLGPTCYTQGICFEGEDRYLKSCNKPWKRAVLWTEDFPTKLKMIQAGKPIEEVSTCS